MTCLFFLVSIIPSYYEIWFKMCVAFPKLPLFCFMFELVLLFDIELSCDSSYVGFSTL
jgi:hypothetical protein